MRILSLATLLAAMAVSSVRAQTTPAKPIVIKIAIHDMAFETPKTPIRVGDIVEWTNTDVVDHTSTAVNGAWDVTIAVGKSVRVTMKQAGALDYYCRFHPTMKATLAVSRRGVTQLLRQTSRKRESAVARIHGRAAK